tara:strand:+ start:23673 stop:25016 length:1344 start_codon:yes stop_codon:yes gene_type:complete
VFRSILIANRGEIALRVIRTARRLGITAIAVYSDADEHALHVRDADIAVRIGPAPAAASYLDAEAILAAARASGAEAVHPGYGFLSENSEFARRVIAAGIAWIGPDPDTIDAMGDKIAARNLMADAGVPIARGTREPVASVEDALIAAGTVGYPLMVKAAAGGGGIGMSAVADADELNTAFGTAQARAQRFFGDSAILLEQLVSPARHIEVQVLGLADGTVVALGERECSVQRRHQKIIEETPSPALTDQQRAEVSAAAVRAAEAVQYRGAGTVEFLFSPSEGTFVFLEMNTRLQVEHPITELVFGIDLVEAQLRVAAGEEPAFDPSTLRANGHAIELRLYAEDPDTFRPSPGTIARWEFPPGDGIRIDAGYGAGDVVSPYYDPMIAKLCVWGADRNQALDRARSLVANATVDGIVTNIPLLRRVLDHHEFATGAYDTRVIDRMNHG